MDLLGTIGNLVTSPFFIISLVFWAIAFTLFAIFRKKKKKNVTLLFPFLILIRTKFFNKLFQKIGSKNRKFWRIWFDIGIIISFVLMIGAIGFFSYNFIQLLVNPQPENAILPLIPGVTVSGQMFSYLILPILINLTFHELSHAIAAEIDGVKVKSSGLLGAGIFFIIGFGAFVEVDDFQMYSKEISRRTRLRAYAGGIWSNVIIALIFIFFMSISPQLHQIGYENQTFQVQTVLPAVQGGFNEGILQEGEIAYAINGTRLDYQNGITLDSFLTNGTSWEVRPGNTLQLTCYNATDKEFYEKELVLGHRSWVGFTYINNSDTSIQVTNIYTHLEGGNNVGNIPLGAIISEVNGTNLDYPNGITFEYLLTQMKPPYQLELKTENGTSYLININYNPLAATAFLFQDIFLGIQYDQINSTAIEISTVLNNGIENGINEGNIPEGTIIIAVNGILIDLTNATFSQWLENEINPQIGEILIFADNHGETYSLIVGNVPVLSVFIGIVSSYYWIPRNFIGRVFGGQFPLKFDTFLYYTWIVAFSLAIFNLLPTAIFDGGRLVKELIDKIFGTEYDPEAQKKLHYVYDPEEPDQHLMTHNITEIISVKRLDPINPEIITPTKGEVNLDNFSATAMLFDPIDDYNNDFIDKIHLPQADEITEGTLIQVEIKYIQDLKAPIKNKVFKWISWTMGSILLASFAISIIKFGNTFFWI